jgi:hypothetical protein
MTTATPVPTGAGVKNTRTPAGLRSFLICAPRVICRTTTALGRLVNTDIRALDLRKAELEDAGG